MDLDKEFGTDKKREVEGTWIPLEVGKSGEVLIARIQNVNWRRLARKLPKSIRRQMNDDLLPEGTLDEITAELMAKSIILGWKGLTIGGQEVIYSTETCMEILLKYPDFRTRLYDMASDIENFRVEQVSDLGKD